ncbi:MAG TPA: hypothetical protein VHN18_01140 [Micromonosporaceae bacterium]|nr:hypothetical protein [Micromonosporaceae bacterium]
MAGRMTVGSVALDDVVRPASEPDRAGAHRTLPVLPELTALLPGRGLRRGSTVAVAAGPPAPSGGTSLMLALLAEASRSGSWCAVVGVPALGLVAAADTGIAVERLALVPHPGPEWATVVAALIDGVDVVVTAIPAAVTASVASRLAARARQRGSVLVPYGRWDGADLTLQVVRGVWEGLGQGRGRLRRRELTILARGRGAAARPKEVKVWMPGDRSAPRSGFRAARPLRVAVGVSGQPGRSGRSGLIPPPAGLPGNPSRASAAGAPDETRPRLGLVGNPSDAASAASGRTGEAVR